MKQKAEITIELEETVVLREGSKVLSGFCPFCRDNVHMFPPEVLAQMTGSSEREIFRLLEAGKIHFTEARRIYACASCYNALHSAISGPANQYSLTKGGRS